MKGIPVGAPTVAESVSWVKTGVRGGNQETPYRQDINTEKKAKVVIAFSNSLSR